MVTIDEVRSYPEQWVDTSYLRTDGKTDYRERKEFGNRHVVFENGAYYGTVHVDKYNATDVPFGTINHAAYYVEEKTGIPKDAILVASIVLGLVTTYKTLKWAARNKGRY